MALEPKAFLNFAAEHYSLLLDIFYKDTDLTEAEIYEQIKKNRREYSNRPEYIFNQLLSLKIIQSPPDATAYYEISHNVKNLLTFLEQEHRFTSTKEIQAYLDEMDSLRHQLEIAFKENKRGVVLNILRDLAGLVERLRQSSNGNRLAIIREVREIKLNINKESSTNRYEKILDIVDRYINPLQDMIEVGKSLDKSLKQLEVLLNYAENEYAFERDVLFKVRRVSLYLPRLRRELLTAFQESTEEITPLLEKLQANLFGRGVTIILNNVTRKGAKALEEMSDRLALPSTRQRLDLFDDFKVSEFLRDVKGYKPKAPPQINHEEIEIEKPYIFNPDSVLIAFKADLPVENAFAWVRARYEGEELGTLLKIYNLLISNAGVYQYRTERQKHSIKNYDVYTYPLLIEALK